MKRFFWPVWCALLALAVAAIVDVVQDTRRSEQVLHRGALEYDRRHLQQEVLRIIDNPFDATLLAQPNRGPINIVAPYRVTVGAAAVQLTTSGNVNGGVCVKALVPGQTMYLGLAGVTTATGWPMTDNESLCLEVRNANVVYAIASAAAQAVAVLPFSRF